jgi:BirA family biotin operon repressor/biotin-[acetyl-CoA-carboxylase] ligase
MNSNAPTQRPLTAADLLPGGPLRRVGRHLMTFAEIPSTNAWLLDGADELPDGTVAWAEYQSGGRGRQGRRWLAPRGSSLMVSVLFLEPERSPLLHTGTMLAAVATCQAVDACSTCCPELRWPNDLFVAGRKLGGVLAESRRVSASRDAARASRALVIGIGLNCLQQPGHFPPELAGLATSLEIECREPVDRAAVARTVLERIDGWLFRLESSADGSSALRAAWLQRCHELGARVTLYHDGREHRGTVLEITGECDLLVQLDDGGRRQFAAATTTRLA